MRLSRKVLAGLAGVASLAILGSLIWALDTSKRSQQSGQELFNTDNKTTPDGLASLPKDYTGLPQNVPQLGPPLPGDLGRPSSMPIPPVRPRLDLRRRNSASRRKARPPAPADCFRRPAPGNGRRSVRPCGVGHHRRRAERILRGGPEAADRSRFRSEHAGPQARLSQRSGRSPHRQLRPADESGLILCPAGGHNHTGGFDHRHPIRPAGPDHRAGHGKCLRQPDGPFPPRAARRQIDRQLRQPGVLRPISCPARLEPDRLSERPIDRA